MDVLIFIGSIVVFIYSVIGLYLQEFKYIFFEMVVIIIILVLVGNWMERKVVVKMMMVIEDLISFKVEMVSKVMFFGIIV